MTGPPEPLIRPKLFPKLTTISLADGRYLFDIFSQQDYLFYKIIKIRHSPPMRPRLHFD
jgi:hypothetical protein